MPNLKSAKKAHRVSLRKKVINSRKKAKITRAKRALNKLFSSDKIKLNEIQGAVRDYTSALDKASKTNYFPKKRANRYKSRLAKKVANLIESGKIK